ncbi:MAG: nitrophenyl compound nitroreductase subunit ArsF family protein [Patescibacteria group bacterium]|nr:nitrophenyl compound nitroreductase subunit ArsF family protein [Patescibacteria group bacterium]
MQKKIIISIITVAIIGTIFFIVKNGNKLKEVQSIDNQTEKNQDNLSKSTAKISAKKIEVVHFHATQQCWSCITVGEYALKTIKEKFPEEYKNGTIVFENINYELPENNDMVMEYQARGSSLFVNAIMDEKDNIEEDVTVWRLVSNENQFISYFQDKLNKLLGK